MNRRYPFYIAVVGFIIFLFGLLEAIILADAWACEGGSLCPVAPSWELAPISPETALGFLFVGIALTIIGAVLP
jgi:hypothetical protein